MRCVLAAAVLLAVPSPAQASTLTVEFLSSEPGHPGTKYGPGSSAFDHYAVRLAGVGDEANRFVLATTPAGDFRVRDDGAELRAGEGCTVDPDGWASCAPPGRSPGAFLAYQYTVETGPGADRLQVDAGEGREIGAAARFTADLGDGDDSAVLAGVHGRLSGGAGDDALRSEAPGALTWDGGPGADASTGAELTVSYETRTAGVRVTPDGVADDGEPGESDDVGAGVVHVVGGAGADELHANGYRVHGGPGDDLLVGGPLVDELQGGDGDDTLRGGDGADDLHGGPGADVVEGGPGHDALDPGPGADRVDGGPGDDSAGVDLDAAPDSWRGGDGRDALSLGRHDFWPLDVTLDGRANDGTFGERDNVAPDWEVVVLAGGRLVGDARPNELRVGPFGTLIGGAGDDVLSGAETVDGGPGRDRIEHVGAGFVRQRPRIDVRDGEPDEVRCEASPLALRRDPVDRIRGCFAVAKFPGAVRTRELRRGAPLAVPLRCAGFQPCRGRVTVQAGRRTVATARFHLPGGATRILRLRPRPGGVALVRSCRRLRVIATTLSPFADDVPHREVQVGAGAPARSDCPGARR